MKEENKLTRHYTEIERLSNTNLIMRGEFIRFGRVHSSCSTSGTRGGGVTPHVKRLGDKS